MRCLGQHKCINQFLRAHFSHHEALPECMCLVVLPIGTFGAIGAPSHTFISELSRRMRASVPYTYPLLPHASWATPRLGPMIRMALTHRPSAGVAWRPQCTTTCGAATAAVSVATVSVMIRADDRSHGSPPKSCSGELSEVAWGNTVDTIHIYGSRSERCLCLLMWSKTPKIYRIMSLPTICSFAQ
jgi:hypothetical protein